MERGGVCDSGYSGFLVRECGAAGDSVEARGGPEPTLKHSKERIGLELNQPGQLAAVDRSLPVRSNRHLATNSRRVLGSHPCTHLAEMLRVFLILEATDPVWSILRRHCEGFTYHNIGNNWPRIRAGTPNPIRIVGFEFAEQGAAGWSKSASIILRSFRR